MQLDCENRPKDILRCLRKCARWFPQVVPGASSWGCPALTYSSYRAFSHGVSMLPLRIVQGRAEPVKTVCDQDLPAVPTCGYAR
jgi:hypothetical protein